jgi:peptide/nickel transport system substrate-binding protein
VWSGKRCLSKVELVIPLLFLQLLAVACGTAAPRAEPVVEEQIIEEVEKVVVTTPIPTPAAEAVTAPPVVEVHPGKLTIMAGDLANERFDFGFTLGTGVGGPNYGRIVGGFLISDNERREMVPGIASEWSLSADGLTWTFAIREGVKFHDGSEVTPEDVLWTLQHTFGPQAHEWMPSSAARISRLTDKVELTEAGKVSLTTQYPVTELAYILSEAYSGWYQVLPKRAKLHDPEVEAAYDKNPIGAGFMRLTKHVPAIKMEFQRFDDYYYQPKYGFPEDNRVNFQSLDLFLVLEEATRVAAVRAGEADLVPVSLASKQQVEAGGGRMVFGNEGVYLDVRLYGCYEPQYPCHDKRVRHALNYAIDKELMRDRLYGGPEAFEVKGYNGITPSTIGYTPGLDPRPFDPDKARQLLADAGYPGGQGFGELIVNVFPSPSMPNQVNAALLAAEFWKRELGLDVEVKVGDSTALKDQANAGELNGQILWRDNETETDKTSSISGSHGDPQNLNRLHEDPGLLRLVQETIQIVDSDQRAEALKTLYLRLHDESYYVSIGYAHIPWAVGPRVLTWQPYPLSAWPSAYHTITLK